MPDEAVWIKDGQDTTVHDARQAVPSVINRVIVKEGGVMYPALQERKVYCQGDHGDCGKTLTIPAGMSVAHSEWARHDAYGIYTGQFCDDCYEDDSKYGYKRDRYEHDEPLEPEEY